MKLPSVGLVHHNIYYNTRAKKYIMTLPSVIIIGGLVDSLSPEGVSPLPTECGTGLVSSNRHPADHHPASSSSQRAVATVHQRRTGD